MKKQIMNKMPRASIGRLLALAPQHTNMTDKRSQTPSANNKVSIAGKEPGFFNPVIDTLEEKSMLETETRERGGEKGLAGWGRGSRLTAVHWCKLRRESTKQLQAKS
jgi:hypothetical protein